MKRRDVLTGILKVGGGLSLGVPLFVVPSRARATTTLAYVGLSGRSKKLKNAQFFPPSAEAGPPLEVAVDRDRVERIRKSESGRFCEALTGDPVIPAGEPTDRQNIRSSAAAREQLSWRKSRDMVCSPAARL